MLGTLAEVELRLFAAAPGAREVLERRKPRCRRSTKCCSTRCRSPSTAAAQLAVKLVPLPHEPQTLERELRVDGRDRPRVRRDQLREARPSRHDRRLAAPRAPRGCGRRSRRPGRRSRRRAPTGAPATVVCEITRSGAANGTLGSRAARANSASIEISMPGASTPPTNSPAAETTSKFVEVPKSTTTAGAPWRSPRCDGIRDPVGADLARIVVANRHARRDARPEHEQLDARPPLGERLVLAHELRHRRAEHDPVERLEVDERAKQHGELVAGVPPDSVPTRNCSASRRRRRARRRSACCRVDREQHSSRARAAGLRARRRGREVAHPLGERLGGERRLLAVAAELLDGHVARRPDLDARDHPRRPALVPDPDVLHLHLEERVRRLRARTAGRACCRDTSRPASARSTGRACRPRCTPS